MSDESKVTHVCVGAALTFPFPSAAADKAQALKPLEEAAEVFGAWQEMERQHASGDGDPWARAQLAGLRRTDLLDECADTIMATCNLVAALGVEDFRPYMVRCELRNRERGRYELARTSTSARRRARPSTSNAGCSSAPRTACAS